MGMNLARMIILVYEDQDLSSNKDNLLYIIIEILSHIHTIQRRHYEKQQHSVLCHIHCNGIPISMASRLIKNVMDKPILYFKAMRAMCYLPIATDESDPCWTQVLDFSKSALCFLADRNLKLDLCPLKEKGCMNEANIHETYLTVMNRIKLLTKTFPGAFVNNMEIAELVVCCKRQMLHSGLYKNWFELLLSIVDNTNTTTSDGEDDVKMQNLHQDIAHDKKGLLNEFVIMEKEVFSKRYLK